MKNNFFARKTSSKKIPIEDWMYCESCGLTKKQLEAKGIALTRHHHDYKLPLNVIILCSVCHTKEHKRLRLQKKITRLEQDIINTRKELDLL